MHWRRSADAFIRPNKSILIPLMFGPSNSRSGSALKSNELSARRCLRSLKRTRPGN